MYQLNRKLGVLILVVFSAGLITAQSTTPAGVDPAAALKEADLEFCRSVQEHGLEGWMSYFAENSTIGPSDAPVQGKEAIRAIFAKVFARQDLNFQWVPTAGEIFGSGELGYTSGHARMTYLENGARRERTSRYVTVWAKQRDGSWKVIGDFGAADLSPVAAPVSCR